MTNTITLIDIDETLFFTKAKIRVLSSKTGKLIRTLTNQEYNVYIIAEDEELDFSEFIDTDVFVNTSTPNLPMIKKLQELFENTKTTNSEVYLLTARQDFDDKDKFLEFLVKSGIEAGHKDDQKIHVIRAGNIPGLDNAGKKYHIIKKMLEGNSQFKTVRLYDDSEENLEAFKEIELDYPEMNVEGYLITDGVISTF
jgi:hypothetical protein